MFFQELSKTPGFTKWYSAFCTYHPRTYVIKCPQSFGSNSELTSFCLQTGGCPLAGTDFCSHRGLSCYSRISQHLPVTLWSFTLGSAASHLLRKVLQALPHTWRTNDTWGRGWGSCPASSGWGSRYHQHSEASLASVDHNRGHAVCVKRYGRSSSQQPAWQDMDGALPLPFLMYLLGT